MEISSAPAMTAIFQALNRLLVGMFAVTDAPEAQRIYVSTPASPTSSRRMKRRDASCAVAAGFGVAAKQLRAFEGAPRSLRPSSAEPAGSTSCSALIMKKLAVLYATREGQTRRIAEHAASIARARGWFTDVFDVAELDDGWKLDGYASVLLAASIHAGKHEREMLQFVKRHRTELEGMPSALLSVSLTQANAEDPARAASVRLEAQKDVQRMLDDFYTSTGFRPTRVSAVAGALLYSRYNLLIRYVMKRIAKSAGGPTDTSRDYELTDWAALDRFIADFVGAASARSAETAQSLP
jgi:menaquinone-dependent protoporphyrinogen oxidase